MDYSSDDDIPDLDSETDSDESSSTDYFMPDTSSDSEGEIHSDIEMDRDSPFEIVENGEISVIANGILTTPNETSRNQSYEQEDTEEELPYVNSNFVTTQQTLSNNHNLPFGIPDLARESDSDESGWSTVDETTETSDTSDDDEESFMFSMSEESSLADEDEYGLFSMLSQQFELFSNVAPSFFGISLQMLYERLVESLEPEEEKDTPTPQHILDSLPTTKVTLAQVASNLSCCICFGEFITMEDLLKLPCSHFYHKDCIMCWLKIKSTCPTCRLDLSKHKPDDKTPQHTEMVDIVEESSVSETMNLTLDTENNDSLLSPHRSPGLQRSSLRNSSYTTAVEERTCLSPSPNNSNNAFVEGDPGMSSNTLVKDKINPLPCSSTSNAINDDHITNNKCEATQSDTEKDIACPCELLSHSRPPERRRSRTRFVRSFQGERAKTEQRTDRSDNRRQMANSSSHETEIW